MRGWRNAFFIRPKDYGLQNIFMISTQYMVRNLDNCHEMPEVKVLFDEVFTSFSFSAIDFI